MILPTALTYARKWVMTGSSGLVIPKGVTLAVWIETARETYSVADEYLEALGLCKYTWKSLTLNHAALPAPTWKTSGLALSESGGR